VDVNYFTGLSKGACVAVDLAGNCPAAVNALIMVNSFMHSRPADKEERLNLHRLLSDDDGGERRANALLLKMGVDRYPSIVKGFKNSLKTMIWIFIQRLFSELADYD
jgi:hypothetical protein